MSYTPALQNELARMAASGQPGQVDLDVGVGRLDIRFQAVDQLACAVERLAVVRHRQSRSIDQLKDIAADLAKRLGYLLEPIHPIEVDEDACVVQMRSLPPEQGDDGTRYYELVVARGELRLCRFEKPPGQVRRTIPAQLTREVLLRLVDDLVAALQ